MKSIGWDMGSKSSTYAVYSTERFHSRERGPTQWQIYSS
jgi:hypothetical protein